MAGGPFGPGLTFIGGLMLCFNEVIHTVMGMGLKDVHHTTLNLCKHLNMPHFWHSVLAFLQFFHILGVLKSRNGSCLSWSLRGPKRNTFGMMSMLLVFTATLWQRIDEAVVWVKSHSVLGVTHTYMSRSPIKLLCSSQYSEVIHENQQQCSRHVQIDRFCMVFKTVLL